MWAYSCGGLASGRPRARTKTTKDKMMFVILTKKGFVADFNEEHGVVSFCEKQNFVEHAKKFKDEQEAMKFVMTYGDAGTGLSKQDVEIKKV